MAYFEEELSKRQLAVAQEEEDADLRPRGGECQLLGVFGITVQLTLGILSIATLISKKFLPGERRTWNVFCLDIWKQLGASLYAHFLNMILAMYLKILTNSGNGCVWYLLNHSLDCTFGLVICYYVHKWINAYAERNNIEELKSGVYVSETVDLTKEDSKDPNKKKLPNTDKQINCRIWVIQFVVWCMIITLSKVIVFIFEVLWYKPIVRFGIWILTPVENNPDLELIIVMIFVPVIGNSFLYWIQDNFLKGDKHIDKRLEAQQKAEEERQRLLEEKRKREEEDRKRAHVDDNYVEEEDSDGFIVFKNKPVRLNRQIEEAVLGIDKDDYNNEGLLIDKNN